MEKKNVNHAYPRNLWERLTRLANLKGSKLTGYVNNILWRHVESEEKKK